MRKRNMYKYYKFRVRCIIGPTANFCETGINTNIYQYFRIVSLELCPFNNIRSRLFGYIIIISRWFILRTSSMHNLPLLPLIYSNKYRIIVKVRCRTQKENLRMLTLKGHIPYRQPINILTYRWDQVQAQKCSQEISNVWRYEYCFVYEHII